MYNSLRPHGLQHTRLPHPSPFPRVSQTHVRWVSNAIQPHPTLSSLLLLPSVFPSNRVFPSESVLHIRWPKYWSFSISPSNEYSGLIFFRIDCFDLFGIQGTLKSLLQHHSSKASILLCSAFFISRNLCVAVWLYLKISLGDLSFTVNKDLCYNFSGCKELLILIMLQCRLYSLLF